jgi:hypothetical protein
MFYIRYFLVLILFSCFSNNHRINLAFDKSKLKITVSVRGYDGNKLILKLGESKKIGTEIITSGKAVFDLKRF